MKTSRKQKPRMTREGPTTTRDALFMPLTPGVSTLPCPSALRRPVAGRPLPGPGGADVGNRTSEGEETLTAGGFVIGTRKFLLLRAAGARLGPRATWARGPVRRRSLPCTRTSPTAVFLVVAFRRWCWVWSRSFTERVHRLSAGQLPTQVQVVLLRPSLCLAKSQQRFPPCHDVQTLRHFGRRVYPCPYPPSNVACELAIEFG